ELEMRSGESGEPIIYNKNRVDIDIDIDVQSHKEEKLRRDDGKIDVNGEKEGKVMLRFHELNQDDAEGVSKEKDARKGGYIKSGEDQEGVAVLIGLQPFHVGKEVEEGGVKEKEDRIISEDDEGGVELFMGLEFDQVEMEEDEGGVKEQGGVVTRAKFDMNNLKKELLEDDEGGVKEKGVVVERQFNWDKVILKDDEGGVVVMGPEFETNDIEIEEGGVMIKDNKEGDVEEKNSLQSHRIGDDIEIEEVEVMRNYDQGGVDVVMGPEFD
ncbi:hypothetical protein O9G_006280, partial [Rozella allomycis CSF55]